MSRTKHSLPRSCHKNLSNINQRKRNMSTIDSINEEHLKLKIRHLCRILGNKRNVSNPYDDFKISAWGEFQNKHFYDNEE
jgi:hypothetical protein